MGIDRGRAQLLVRARRKAVRFARLPLREQAATVHALLVAVVVEALIRWVRLPRLAALAGVSLEARGTPARPVVVADGLGPDVAPATVRAEDVARAVRATHRVLRIWPFGDGPCLRESLVLGRLLRRRRPLLRIGLADRPASGLAAHAWVEVGGVPLGDSDGFTVFRPAGGSGR